MLRSGLPGEGQLLGKPSRLEIGGLLRGQVVSAERGPATPAGKVLKQDAGVLSRLAGGERL